MRNAKSKEIFIIINFILFYSYDRGTTYNVYVGKKQIIEGMDKALIGMCVNERRLVKIPPSLAYGSEGVGKCLTCMSYISIWVLASHCSS